MKILNLLNPIKNTLDRLATAHIAIYLAALTLAATPARSQVILVGMETTPSSVVNQTTLHNEGFQMVSRTYAATALATYIGQTTKIRIASPDANTIGYRIIFEDIAMMTSVPATIPPPLTSFESNKIRGPIHVNEQVTCIVFQRADFRLDNQYHRLRQHGRNAKSSSVPSRVDAG